MGANTIAILRLFSKNILQYPELLKFVCLKFIWEFKCNKLPSTFSNTFYDANPAAPNNGYNLRVGNNFFVPICWNGLSKDYPFLITPGLGTNWMTILKCLVD